MNWKKKITFSLLTAMSLIVQAFSSIAFADNTVWSVVNYGTNNTDTAVYYAKPDTELVYAGDVAMKICYNPQGTRVDTDYIEIRNQLSQTLPAGDYTLSFYNAGRLSVFSEVSISDENIYRMDNEAWVKETQTDGVWTKCSISFDYSGSSGENFFAFRVYAKTALEIIDNISLVDENGTEYIIDGGFESFAENDGNDDNEDDGNDDNGDDGNDDENGDNEGENDDNNGNDENIISNNYQPKNILLSAIGSGAVFSWKNPSASSLEKISLYLIENNEEKLLADDFDATPSNIIRYNMNESAALSAREYKFVFSFSDNEDYVYYYSCTPTGVYRKTVENWEFETRNNAGADYSDIEIILDQSEGYEGDTAVKFVANSNHRSNVYATISQTIPMEVGEKYKISFMTKGEALNGPAYLHMSWKFFDGMGETLVANELNGTYEWVLCERIFTSTAENETLLIGYDYSCDAFYVDNVTCYKLDSNGETIGENLIVDGSFEGLVQTEVGQVSNASATPQISAIKLKWNTNETNVAGVNIYESTTDGYIKRATLNSGQTELLLKGLKHNTEYNYKIIPFNSDGKEGNSCIVTATTPIPDYVIGEPQLRKSVNGLPTVVENFSGRGRYSVTVNLQNFTITNGVDAEVIVAIYNSNNEMVFPVYSDKKSVQISDGEVWLETIFELDSGQYTAEVTVIDKRNNLNILTEFKKFN